jgi:hypothetical protein
MGYLMGYPREEGQEMTKFSVTILDLQTPGLEEYSGTGEPLKSFELGQVEVQASGEAMGLQGVWPGLR